MCYPHNDQLGRTDFPHNALSPQCIVCTYRCVCVCVCHWRWCPETQSSYRWSTRVLVSTQVSSSSRFSATWPSWRVSQSTTSPLLVPYNFTANPHSTHQPFINTINVLLTRSLQFTNVDISLYTLIVFFTYLLTWFPISCSNVGLNILRFNRFCVSRWDECVQAGADKWLSVWCVQVPVSCSLSTLKVWRRCLSLHSGAFCSSLWCWCSDSALWWVSFIAAPPQSTASGKSSGIVSKQPNYPTNYRLQLTRESLVKWVS